MRLKSLFKRFKMPSRFLEYDDFSILDRDLDSAVVASVFREIRETYNAQWLNDVVLKKHSAKGTSK